ncbi:MAG: 50S ribosomal protein L2 [Patescibacteria group bacterium]|nr:50S ribosomal protein L2 [Patescibacteria group bacterium]MDD4304612.1 50S ribosomal protein L2 [Patescibacteria group bacterium]MDD4695539.1 50S ribosomal protein L2 [Patescibacteria group bacterium]
MAIKVYKPTTPAKRKTSVVLNPILSKKSEPLKKLTCIKKKNSGRNNQGRVTVRHQGGGEKRYLRDVDFKRDKYDIPAKVEKIEYDPNRNAFISLVCYKDGERRYILTAEGMQVGQEVISSKTKLVLVDGNRFPFTLIPSGTSVYNVELTPGKGGKMIRGAGARGVFTGIEGKYAQIKLPSSEVRLVPKDCFATIGQVSNSEFRNIRWGKAGRMRHRGIRPTVRGKAMNPCDHPHGGGEGRHPIGMKHPKTPWGKPALGVKTRATKKYSDSMILNRRKKRNK